MHYKYDEGSYKNLFANFYNAMNDRKLQMMDEKLHLEQGIW